MKVASDTVRQLGTVNICLYQFAIINSVFVKNMDFARANINIRRIIYVCF